MILKIFTKENAPETDEAKALGEKIASEGFEVEFLDAEDESVTQSLELYDIYSFPTFLAVGHDGVQQEIWRGKVPLESDVKIFLNQ